ncbi:MAG TPA: glycosyltransferase, partial [Actinomycetota bacterium]|nr:glycosyltransferase [Actinomycetota bacterium]
LQHDLVLVGQTPPGYERFAKGATIGPEDAKAGVTFTGHISNARLAGLYRCADLFVSPSLFEGCGMPIVEALGLGVPTIAAARSAVPEVSQGLAMLVDEPLDVSAWTEAIERALADLASLKPAVEESERLRRHHDPAHVAERYHQVMISI